ncbi:CHAT domain-containing protein [Streptomyces sp. A7024]|uniref:CHAT domain-containing protein n=1 Tax=Streptomyces coryli TaxID=1128680 RepID=A0A6G4TVK7_9ACTN|nr:CHAT domain-containing protein [Streptomyces coryli]NGN63476.1 CHAT domain-containing protein [Streptomyces coryli]
MAELRDLEDLLRRIQAEFGTRAAVTEEYARQWTELIAEHAGTADAVAAFDGHYAHWRGMAAAGTERALYAGYLLQLVPLMRLHGPCCTPTQQGELVQAALAHQDPVWQARIRGVDGLAGLTDRASGQQEMTRNDDAMENLGTAAAELSERGDPAATGIALIRAAARAEQAQQHGGLAELERATDELAEVCGSGALRPDEELYYRCYVATLRAEGAYRRKDEDALARHIREQQTALARLPRHYPERSSAEACLANDRDKLRMLVAQRTGRMPDARQGRPRATVARPAPGSGPNALIAAAHMVTGQAIFDRDVAGLDEAIGMLAEALPQCPDDSDQWIRCASALAAAHLLRAEIVRQQHAGPLLTVGRAGRDVLTHLDQGIDLLRRVVRAAGGPAHPHWAMIGTGLADALRIRAQAFPPVRAAAARRMRAEAREFGLAALPGYAWAALLQSGTEHATQAANRAMGRCLDVARWCIADGELGDAVEALESGRGLVLHAARVAATVPDMLRELGQEGLAEEWRRAGAPAPEGELADPRAAMGTGAGTGTGTGPDVPLRRRVLDVLAASPYRDRLLSAPSTGEVAGALRAIGADAFVFLVPGGERPERDAFAPGAAVIVTADGGVRAVELPRLRLDAPELAAYLEVGSPSPVPRAARVAGPVDGDPVHGGPQGRPHPEAGAALDRLCGWAWRAALGTVAEELTRSGGSAEPAVVLVPVGELGVVPWHAAWRDAETGPVGRRYAETGPAGRRYALQDLQISYMPSARMLCEVAARSAPGGATGVATPAVVVGNPTGDLRHAGEEAQAIHRVFYPAGVHLDARDATAPAVLARLRGGRAGTVHLACHGVVRPGGRHSAYLELAGGSRLVAEELTEAAGPGGGLDLVCLAACWSNVSGRGYDEAYSLATAFLAAGARTVLGSLWPVPDEATSLLMYMAHHYLRRQSAAPAAALRRAQLWMLDPHRRPPPDMPAHLANRVRLIRAQDLAGWAGFTHQGW